MSRWACAHNCSWAHAHLLIRPVQDQWPEVHSSFVEAQTPLQKNWLVYVHKCIYFSYSHVFAILISIRPTPVKMTRKDRYNWKAIYFNDSKLHAVRDAGTMWRQGGRFSWKGTFELIYTKRCLQNIGSWTSANNVFYLLDDRDVRGFSARRLCYSSRQSFKLKGHLCPLAPPGKGQRWRLPLLPPPVPASLHAASILVLFYMLILFEYKASILYSTYQSSLIIIACHHYSLHQNRNPLKAFL
jgi:hypothetical protein